MVAQWQSPIADSIERELNALEPGEPQYLGKKAGIMGTLLQTVKYSDQKKALSLCDELGTVFMELRDSVHAYEAMFRYKAGIYELTGQYDQMLMNLEAYAQALSTIGKQDGYVYLDIGNVYFGFGMYDLAKENYHVSEEIFLKEANLHGLCTIYNNLAQIHMANEHYDSALVWLRKSHAVRRYELKDEILAHESMYLMAKVFRDQEKYDSAIAFLRIVIADLNGTELQQHTDHIALHQEFAGAYTAMGITYTKQMMWDSAEYYFTVGEKLYLQYKYQNRLPTLYTQWARMYIAQENSTKSLEYIKKVERASDRNKPQDALQLYDLYAEYYDLTGNSTEAYRNRMLFYKMEDSLQASGYHEQMIIVGSRVMQLQNEARINGQNAEIERKNKEAQQAEQSQMIILLIAVGLALICIVGAVSLYILRKKNRIIEHYNSDLQSANATKEQLLSVVSHDLRGPFNTLIGISDLMVRNMKNKDYGSVAGNAELVRESSRKAYVLLDNLMQWVSLQKESIEVSKRMVALNELTEEILLLFRGQALANSSTVVKDIRVTHAMTDRNLLQVILRNLVSNALKNIPVAGRVKIEMEAVGTTLRIVIEDNGKGLSSGDLATLFTEKDQTSIARKGGGLGLVLVDKFVRQLNGTISAENVVTGGARFTILLLDAIQPHTAIGKPVAAKSLHPKLTAKDMALLAPVIEQLKKYKIYDTTEIREVISNLPESASVGIDWWKRQIHETVYRSDDAGFRALINVDAYEDIRQ